MDEASKEIIIKIIEDGLLYIHEQKLIQDDTLNRIVSFYFLLIEYEYNAMIEFDDFDIKEKKILYDVIIDGIASIYVDNEYLDYSDIGTKYKERIIQQLLSFFKYITKFSKDKVFFIYSKRVKKYRRKGLNWDNIPY